MFSAIKDEYIAIQGKTPDKIELPSFDHREAGYDLKWKSPVQQVFGFWDGFVAKYCTENIEDDLWKIAEEIEGTQKMDELMEWDFEVTRNENTKMPGNLLSKEYRVLQKEIFSKVPVSTVLIDPSHGTLSRWNKKGGKVSGKSDDVAFTEQPKDKLIVKSLKQEASVIEEFAISGGRSTICWMEFLEKTSDINTLTKRVTRIFQIGGHKTIHIFALPRFDTIANDNRYSTIAYYAERGKYSKTRVERSDGRTYEHYVVPPQDIVRIGQASGYACHQYAPVELLKLWGVDREMYQINDVCQLLVFRFENFRPLGLSTSTVEKYFRLRIDEEMQKKSEKYAELPLFQSDCLQYLRESTMVRPWTPGEWGTLQGGARNEFVIKTRNREYKFEATAIQERELNSHFLIVLVVKYNAFADRLVENVQNDDFISKYGHEFFVYDILSMAEFPFAQRMEVIGRLGGIFPVVPCYELRSIIKDKKSLIDNGVLFDDPVASMFDVETKYAGTQFGDLKLGYRRVYSQIFDVTYAALVGGKRKTNYGIIIEDVVKKKYQFEVGMTGVLNQPWMIPPIMLLYRAFDPKVYVNMDTILKLMSYKYFTQHEKYVWFLQHTYPHPLISSCMPIKQLDKIYEDRAIHMRLYVDQLANRKGDVLNINIQKAIEGISYKRKRKDGDTV